jgi:hypothetical protein
MNPSLLSFDEEEEANGFESFPPSEGVSPLIVDQFLKKKTNKKVVLIITSMFKLN